MTSCVGCRQGSCCDITSVLRSGKFIWHNNGFQAGKLLWRHRLQSDKLLWHKCFCKVNYCDIPSGFSKVSCYDIKSGFQSRDCHMSTSFGHISNKKPRMTTHKPWKVIECFSICATSMEYNEQKVSEKLRRINTTNPCMCHHPTFILLAPFRKVNLWSMAMSMYRLHANSMKITMHDL